MEKRARKKVVKTEEAKGEKREIKIKKGSRCIWRNKLGEEKIGIFLEVKGLSGRQALFRPETEDGLGKIIYVDVEQLIEIRDK